MKFELKKSFNNQVFLRYFHPNETLIKLYLKGKTSTDKISFEELFGLIFQKLAPMHQIKKISKDGKKIEGPPEAECFLRKGKFQPVEFKLESRGGNKKVTSVHHLATFEPDFQQLQQKIRKEIGCSVTLNELESTAAGASMIPTNEFVLGVQGNQITQIAELLKSKIKIKCTYSLLSYKFQFLLKRWTRNSA